MNKKTPISIIIILVIFFSVLGFALAENEKGTLEIIGVPNDVVAGRYDSDEGIFYADVTGVPDALIKVDFNEVLIFGYEMELNTKNNYAFFTNDARLEKDDFELTAKTIEYFGDDKILLAKDNVLVVTEDASVYADHLKYNEDDDEALFTGNVRVIFEDGEMEGEKFLMFLEKSELQFYGSFQGEFKTEDK